MAIQTELRKVANGSAIEGSLVEEEEEGGSNAPKRAPAGLQANTPFKECKFLKESILIARTDVTREITSTSKQIIFKT